MTPRGCSFICVIQILSASTAFAQIINAPTPHSGKINPYTVDGFALGARIDFRKLPRIEDISAVQVNSSLILRDANEHKNRKLFGADLSSQLAQSCTAAME